MEYICVPEKPTGFIVGVRKLELNHIPLRQRLTRQQKSQIKMGQLSLTIVTSFVVVLTYYLVMFSVFVSATPISSSNTAERPDEQPMQIETSRNDKGTGRLFKPMFYAYNFNRNIRTPFSSSIGQRLVPAIPHSKVQPLEFDLLVDDDDFIDKSKRYDDYGHMRFGKRGDDQFDDYGHMRFGKRSE